MNESNKFHVCVSLETGAKHEFATNEIIIIIMQITLGSKRKNESWGRYKVYLVQIDNVVAGRNLQMTYSNFPK